MDGFTDAPNTSSSENQGLTFTAAMGASPGFMEIPSSPMNPAPAIGGMPDYGSWQIPSPGSDGALPVPGSGIISMGRTGGSDNGMQPRDGGRASEPTSGVIDFDSQPIPNFDQDPSDGVTGSQYAFDKGISVIPSSSDSPRTAEEKAAQTAARGGKFDYLAGIMDKPITSANQLPDLKIEGFDAAHTDALKVEAYLLASGQAVNLDGYKDSFDSMFKSRLNYDNMLAAAGRPTDAASLAKDENSLPALANQLNQAFAQEGWPVRLNVSESKPGEANANAKLELDQIDPNTSKPTGAGWSYTVSLPPKTEATHR